MSEPGQQTIATKPRQYFAGFDGLRGLSAISVVIYHYFRYSETANPVIAWIVYAVSVSPGSVDMFFILSGFLIGTILLQNREASNYYKVFFARRVYRILPLYYAWIGLFFLFFFLRPGYGIAWPKGYTGLGIVAIYLGMLQNNFVSVLEGSVMVGTSWTLGIEEPFYVLAPICMRKLKSKKAMAWIFGGIAAVSLLFRFLLHKIVGGGVAWGSEASYGAYYWTASRICAPALGCLLALAWDEPRIKSWVEKHRWIFYAGIPTLIAMYITVENADRWGIPHAAGVQILFDRTTLILSAMCLVTAVLAHQDGPLTRFLEWPIFKRFGMLSYCVYLTHWGIIWMMARFVVHKQFEQDPWLGVKLAPFAFLVTWGLAELSWKYFEGPLVKRGQSYRYARPQLSQPAAARAAAPETALAPAPVPTPAPAPAFASNTLNEVAQ